MARKGLNPKQQRFVEEYLVDLNAGQAYLRAGYAAKNANTARVQAHHLLMNPNIQAAIQKARTQQSERTLVTADMVIAELAKIAFSKMDRFSSWGPNGVILHPSSELSEDDSRCVSEVSQTVSKDGGSIKFKLHDKTNALGLLGKHLGILKDIHEISGPGGKPIQYIDVAVSPGNPERNGHAAPIQYASGAREGMEQP